MVSWSTAATGYRFNHYGECCSTLPGSHERFFRAVGMPVSAKASFEPPADSPDMEKILASAERNDIYFVLTEETHG